MGIEVMVESGWPSSMFPVCPLLSYSWPKVLILCLCHPGPWYWLSLLQKDEEGGERVGRLPQPVTAWLTDTTSPLLPLPYRWAASLLLVWAPHWALALPPAPPKPETVQSPCSYIWPWS
jgi:hypothetical protein